jgi:hypothetical protein
MNRLSLLKGAETVQGLLEVAKDSIPQSHWKRTPVVLKATAGLRLLPEKKAQALLFEVIFEICSLDNSVFSSIHSLWVFRPLQYDCCFQYPTIAKSLW